MLARIGGSVLKSLDENPLVPSRDKLVLYEYLHVIQVIFLLLNGIQGLHHDIHFESDVVVYLVLIGQCSDYRNALQVFQTFLVGIRVC